MHSSPRAPAALAYSAFLLMLAVLLAGGCASAPADERPALQASHLYNGIGRPLIVVVPTVAEPSIALLGPADEPVEPPRPCAAGEIDLAVIFPRLWTEPAREVRYAQLLSRGTPVGAALVLQPLTSPRTAVLVDPQSGRAFWIDDTTGAPSSEARAGVLRYYSESPIVNAGLRVYPERHVVLETSLGDMEFAMRPDAAPNTGFNFLHLAAGGFYTGVVFHRVVPRGRDGNPFVIQVGDPTGTGDGGPGYAVDMEPSTLPHDFGVISMARDSEPNTNGSQVFVCLSREGTARLDGKYCAFGTLVRGGDVVRAIAATPLVEGTDRPSDPPVLRRAVLVDAPPRPVPAALRSGT